jgi:hypothetical protein
VDGGHITIDRDTYRTGWQEEEGEDSNQAKGRKAGSLETEAVNARQPRKLGNNAAS